MQVETKAAQTCLEASVEEWCTQQSQLQEMLAKVCEEQHRLKVYATEQNSHATQMGALVATFAQSAQVQ